MPPLVNHTFIAELKRHRTLGNNALEVTFKAPPKGGLVWQVNEGGSLPLERKQIMKEID